MPETSQIAAGFKLVILPRTKQGLGRAGLRHHLEHVHGPLVMAHPEASGVFRSYVHHYALDEGPHPFSDHLLEGRDAVSIIRFASPLDIATSKDSAAYREIIGPDEDNFRDLAGSVALRCEEIVVVPDASLAATKVFLFLPASDMALSELAERLSVLCALRGIAGVTANRAHVLEGDWSAGLIVELALLENSDRSGIVACWHHAGLPTPSQVLITQPLTFRALEGSL